MEKLELQVVLGGKKKSTQWSLGNNTTLFQAGNDFFGKKVERVQEEKSRRRRRILTQYHFKVFWSDFSFGFWAVMIADKEGWKEQHWGSGKKETSGWKSVSHRVGGG